MTEILGHRGCRKRFHDNTMEAFWAAYQYGCDGIELDARPTSDGRLALYHDAKLRARTVYQTSSTEIASADSRILFDDKLAELPPYPGMIQLELKPAPVHIWRHHIRLISAFATNNPNVVVTSFDRQLLTLINRDHPELRRGLLVDKLDCNPVGLAWGLGCELIAVRDNSINLSLLRKAKAYGLAVSVWTVNSLKRAKYLKTLGVDQIITDRPWAFCPQLSR
ncbi:glycerophosphodiester phosphodiesterase [uncultured Umboniibacter sp.]|uniref:glycerophosphodiester phosphodiesterase n=1 Tax=uncultured Umboniibacter sp. TaxID=1798917 RepID=UPI00260682BF|nr:glycerophosphodiester phosphodiesterase [uncultured Umboniibacter sp.]